jgi:hypothetical protein
MPDKKWKCVIALIFLSLAIIVILNIYSEQCNEEFGVPQSEASQAGKNDSAQTKDQLNAEFDKKLNNTLGDVLLEWDFEDSGDLLNGGEMEGVAVHTLKCSRSCCPSQWPLPSELRDKGNMCGRDLVRSNYTCGNGSGSGCVCLPRKNYNMIARRGNNATWNDADRN